MDADDEDVRIPITHPDMPAAVRAFAGEFIRDVHWVAINGQAYWLLDESGDWVDICWPK